ncbi:MAG: HTTM domain-containing protein [Chitinophagaceae bacterium]|nr:HTTM domain-containing protein [Chitinophagaceae bacterium]
MLIIGACFVLLALNLFGIGRNAVSILLFLSLTLLNSINDRINNSGDEMSLLLMGYLSIANTFSYFTLFKRKPLPPAKEKLYNLISNLAAYSIVINLCLAYFFAGLFKLLDPYWQNGTSLHYFLNDDRHSILAAGGKYVQFPALFLYIVNYGTLLLEVSFPVLIWYKKYRNWVLLLCFLMHLGIYTFLMVYAMSLIFVLQYGMFYSNEEMLALSEKIKAGFRRLFSFAIK